METSIAPFDPARYAEVVRLCREGRSLAGRGDASLALDRLIEAWDLLPEPKEGWEASSWILAAVGDLLRATEGVPDGPDLLEHARALREARAHPPDPR